MRAQGPVSDRSHAADEACIPSWLLSHQRTAQHAFRCGRLSTQGDAAQWYTEQTRRNKARHPAQRLQACQEVVQYELCRQPPHTQGLCEVGEMSRIMK